PAGLPTATSHPSGDRSASTGCELAPLRPRVPLDAPCRNDGSTPLSDLLATAREPDENESEAAEFLHSLLHVLKPRELVILKRRSGVDGESRPSLSQVSKMLAVSKERVRQIQERALQKLRIAADEPSAHGSSRAQQSIATAVSPAPARARLNHSKPEA